MTLLAQHNKSMTNLPISTVFSAKSRPLQMAHPVLKEPEQESLIDEFEVKKY